MLSAVLFMAAYAVVDAKGTTVNAVDWDGVKPFTPPVGTHLVLAKNANPYVRDDAAEEAKISPELQKAIDESVAKAVAKVDAQPAP